MATETNGKKELCIFLRNGSTGYSLGEMGER